MCLLLQHYRQHYGFINTQHSYRIFRTTVRPYTLIHTNLCQKNINELSRLVWNIHTHILKSLRTRELFRVLPIMFSLVFTDIPTWMYFYLVETSRIYVSAAKSSDSRWGNDFGLVSMKSIFKFYCLSHLNQKIANLLPSLDIVRKQRAFCWPVFWSEKPTSTVAK